jgi:hypothetical protein
MMDERIANHLSSMAPVDIPADYAEGVASALDILAQHAATFRALALADEIEPAPVFRA